MTTPARVAVAAVLGVLIVGGAFLYFDRLNQPSVGVPGPSPAPTVVASPSAAVVVDYSTLPGRILMEHLGNALDGSDGSTDVHAERRQLFLMSPSDMTAKTAVEFLPDQLGLSKISADVSPDSTRIVFQDNSDSARVWEANIDGTGLHELQSTCTCYEGDPAYDPSGTRIVFTHIEGDSSWLAIRDLATGAVQRLEGTVGPSSDAIPEQASWSPDGTRIVFSRLTWKGNDSPMSGKLSIADVASGVVADMTLSSSALLPGEPDWSPDGSTILFTDGPLGVTAGIPDFVHNVYTVHPDGTGLRQLTSNGGSGAASWTSDGKHILFYANFFRMMNPDGSRNLPVNAGGMDLSETSVGFSYIGHWVDNP